MHAVLTAFGASPPEALDHLELRDQAFPTDLDPTDVVVRVRAADVNWVDLIMMSGQYQHLLQPPWTPGLQFAGEVVQVGEAVDTWLGDGLDPDFTLYGYVTTGPVGGGRLMYLDGGFGGIEGGWAVAFDENQIAQASLGVDCATELSGTVGVRTPEGQWVDIVFDGNPEGAVPAASCDGCGVGFVQGEVVGDVCVDATSVLDWEQSPW